ncbi:expressed protein [Phakopsora pachyrhizi]|uniref:Expressed protein n=1 Tax=Phakopsora pachyrhizi TaxID=170000 RepID=A0AAV0BSH8_PHAPC|nr:expressed protein [Phakopsora pachyrhizi]
MRLDSLPDCIPTIAEPKRVEIDSIDSVLTRADLAWSISGWRMTDEKRLLVTVLGVRAFTVGLGVIGDLWSRALSSTEKVSREIVFAPEQSVIGIPGFKVPAIETLAIGRIMGGEVEVEVDKEEIISQSMGAGEDEGEGEADEGNCNGGD